MRCLKSCLLIAFALSSALGLWAADRKSGDYTELYAGELTSFNYLVSGSQNEHIMFANTIDNLIEYDQYGVMKSGLATSWSSSPDGLVWTFKLRQGVSG
jgi:ABC-type dipeptide transport system, periplasmic component